MPPGAPSRAQPQYAFIEVIYIYISPRRTFMCGCFSAPQAWPNRLFVSHIDQKQVCFCSEPPPTLRRRGVLTVSSHCSGLDTAVWAMRAVERHCGLSFQCLAATESLDSAQDSLRLTPGGHEHVFSNVLGWCLGSERRFSGRVVSREAFHQSSGAFAYPTERRPLSVSGRRAMVFFS